MSKRLEKRMLDVLAKQYDSLMALTLSQAVALEVLAQRSLSIASISLAPIPIAEPKAEFSTAERAEKKKHPRAKRKAGKQS